MSCNSLSHVNLISFTEIPAVMEVDGRGAVSAGAAEAGQRFLVAAASGGSGLDAGAAALATAAAASVASSRKGGGRWVVDALSVICSGCYHQAETTADSNTLAVKLRPLVHALVTTVGTYPGGGNARDLSCMDVDSARHGGRATPGTAGGEAKEANPVAELDAAAAMVSAVGNAKLDVGCWLFNVLFNDALEREPTLLHLVRATSLAFSFEQKGECRLQPLLDLV